ncbi:MAG: signal peptide peptidase SppA, partial [Methanosarcinales archaeon]|nr:signal peptide peptidase SppA [Methanosarcinales archaeon]
MIDDTPQYGPFPVDAQTDGQSPVQSIQDVPVQYTPVQSAPEPDKDEKTKSKSGKSGWKIAFFALITIAALVIIAAGSVYVLTSDFDLKDPFSLTTGDEIDVIYIQGVMITGNMGDGFGISASETVGKYLREANDDPDVAAIVLRVNSPGGSPAAAQEIVSEINKLKENNKTIVVSMADLAASAAYYISAPTDRIIANDDTITGSIGVIWSFENKSAYNEEEGFEYWVAKSGDFKDMGASWRGLTDEEKNYSQDVVMDAYGRFVNEVADGRNMPVDEVINLSDGRVYTGARAKELGLVDEIGNLYDAIDVAADMAGIEGEPRVNYVNKPSLS